MSHQPAENSPFTRRPGQQSVPAPAHVITSRRRLAIIPEGEDLHEQHVRIGEVKVALRHGEVLIAIGLGSCVGVAIADQHEGIVAMAHVFLPHSSGRDPGLVLHGKFADLAIPRLLELLADNGCSNRARLSAVMVGGARMFEIGNMGAQTLDVGARNLQAVLEQLERHGVRVVSSATGGTRGRSMRLYAGSCAVTAQEVTENEKLIWPQILRAVA